VFRTEALSAEVLLASACLPFLHRTVEIDGEAYWDGGYMGNPALFPLIYQCRAADIVIVRVNPLRRPDLPRTSREILNRVNEIGFNASLLRELRAVGFITRLIAEGMVADGALKRVLVHGIDDEAAMARLGYSSKLNPEWGFLLHLHDLGRKRAGAWLEASFASLGRRSTLDLDDAALEEPAPLPQLEPVAAPRTAALAS
jgi:NTE family protein